MPNHARQKRNSLLRAAATVTVAAAALAATGSASANAAPTGIDSTRGSEADLGAALGPALSPVKNLRLNPLAKTGVDPLDNAVAPQVADFKPVSTAAVTGPLTRGDSVSQLPLVGEATRLLPG
ncbi:hypothetical protein QMK19_10695 [Streptomyces sp. H10-C2]|nr:hypothetical protein [Streptomyces sp. H10-C2]MDJ0370125.1 hypothetical protein [Streptomyces sp. H10-C2]